MVARFTAGRNMSSDTNEIGEIEGETGEGGTPDDRPPAPTTLDFIVAALASIAVIGAILSAPVLLTHDGPHHIYLVHVQNHFSDADSIYPSFYRPSNSITALGFTLLFGPLEDALGWKAALRISLSLICLTWAWGAFRIAQVVHHRRATLGLLGFGIVLQWSLYMGFFSYVLSVGIGFFVVALAIRHETWGPRTRIAIALLLGVQSLYHLFAAQMVAACLLCAVFVRHPVRRWPREVALLALMGAPAIAVLLSTTGAFGADSGGVPDIFKAIVWPSLGDRLRLLAATFTGGPWWRSWPPLLLSGIALVFALIRWRKRQLSSSEKTLLLSSLLLFVLSQLLPFHMPQWEYVSPRFVPVAVVLALALLPVERLRLPAQKTIATILAFAYVAASLFWTARFNQRQYEACEDLMSGIETPYHETGAGVRLPVLLDTLCANVDDWREADMPFVEPAFNAGLYYAIEQGGIVPFAFTVSPKIHPFVFTRGGLQTVLPIPERISLGKRFNDARRMGDLKAQSDAALRFGAFGSTKQDIIYYGPELPRSLLETRGFVTDYTKGKLWLSHFKGCSARLIVQAERANEVVVEYGWIPVFDVIQTATIVMNDNQGIANLSKLPCQNAWIRAYRDVDHSGTFTATDVPCAESVDGGWIAVPSTAGKEIVCSIDR